MLLGRFTSLFAATQVREIPFRPLDISSGSSWVSELWLPSGAHKEHLPEKTSPHWAWRAERGQEAGCETVIGCPTSRLAISIWENKWLYQPSHFDFICKLEFFFLFICLAWCLHNDLTYPTCPSLVEKLFLHQDSLQLSSISTPTCLYARTHPTWLVWSYARALGWKQENQRSLFVHYSMCLDQMILYGKFYYIRYHQPNFLYFRKILSLSGPASFSDNVVTGKGSSLKAVSPVQILICQLQAMWPQMIQLFHPLFPHLYWVRGRASMISQCNEMNQVSKVTQCDGTFIWHTGSRLFFLSLLHYLIQ